jgi:hypothetical protein
MSPGLPLRGSPSPNPFPNYVEGGAEAPSPSLERGLGVRILNLAVNDYIMRSMSGPVTPHPIAHFHLYHPRSLRAVSL